MSTPRKLLLFFVVFLVLPVSLGKAVLLYTDWLWFGEVGYKSVFLTILVARVRLFLVFGGAWFAVFYWALRGARKVGTQVPAPIAGRLIPLDDKLTIDRSLGKVIFIVSLGVSLVAGLIASGRYSWYLKSLHPTAFNLVEPVFHRDASFYVFQFPWWNYTYEFLVTAIIFALIVSFLLFVYDDALQLSGERFYIDPQAVRLTGSLLGLLLLLKVAGYQLAAWGLLFSDHSLLTGASYTDVLLRLPGLRIMMVAAFLMSLALFGYSRRGQAKPVGIVIGCYLGLSLVVGSIVPSLFQNMLVPANELRWERKYLAANIKFTRFAYDLDRIQESRHPARTALSEDMVTRNQATIKNVRIWDKSVLETYRQLQEIRPQYNFLDVDIDRYAVNGEPRQVMLSARELSYDKLQTTSWINYHLKYTHGYGFCMSPVNQSTREGLPELLVKNIPPEVAGGLALKIVRPEIYFGEWIPSSPPPIQMNPVQTPAVPGAQPPGGPGGAQPQQSDPLQLNPLAPEPVRSVEVPYAIVNTTTKEFDYPHADSPVWSTYRGRGGVRISGLGRRLAFAWRFSSLQIVVSRYITSHSRIIFNREIIARARTIAPFLRYDDDAYLVVSQGRLYWIIDAYTLSQHFPYSQQTEPLGNYLRNSVKVVIDAYDGTTSFYRADQAIGRADSVLETYTKVFPSLFKPLSKMPADLQRHLRYPQGLFAVQADVYSRYHMTNIDTFFNDEDLWEVSRTAEKGPLGTAKIPMSPFYVTMRPPLSDQTQLMLVVPFSPKNRDNMRSMLTANCDSPGYGNLTLYAFPKNQNVYGPAQIKALVNQNEEVSKNLSLWGKLGSTVVWGNFVVVPVEDSVFYVQPLYLQSEATRLPELKRVIVVSGDQVVMESNFESALEKVLSIAPATLKPADAAGHIAAAPRAAGVPASSGGSAQSLVDRAAKHYQNSLRAREGGDWERYGKELDALGETLQQLRKITRERH
ncbi:MAG: UPF0182 family protein [Armatimonadetes bacterium]|nr:UPF0182 family protein [Armatimonadota bacterium]